MRKIFTFIAVLFAACMMAEEFEVDGIYYSTLTSNTVQVVKPTSGKYTGDITIPATINFGQTYQVVAIGDYAFQGANQVTSVTLPLTGITSIGGWAFNDCTGLTSFMLPASITSIGERAFYFCDNLHDLYVCATDPASYNPGNMAFSKIHYGSHKCTLHVPTGCTAAYAADPTFSVFTQVEEFDPPVLYDIYIAGTRVTEYNASDILGDGGTVSYNAETKTLTLDGANIDASGGLTFIEASGIYVGEEGVTIKVANQSSIDAKYIGIWLTKDATLTGAEKLSIIVPSESSILMENNSLTIDGANLVLSAKYADALSGTDAKTLTIKSSTITATSDNPYSALGGKWQDVQLIDCYIELPEGGKYDPKKGVVDKNGYFAQTASIKPGVAPVFYDIYVKGIQVSDQNASDILENETVSYNAETKTLTLNEASIDAYGITDMENTGIYVGEEDVTILVAGESTINSAYSGIYLTKDATITGSAQLTIDEHFGSCIAMYNNSLTIDGANLVLSGRYGALGGSGAEGLMIINSTITATADPEYSSPALGGGWQDVQLIDCYIELPEGGKYDPEKGVVDKNDNIAYKVSIKPGVAPVFYDIYVKGIQVSDQNASDIFGDGTVSYNAEANILTLNGAKIVADGATDMEKTGIYVDEDVVTIEVAGASFIDAAYEGIYLTKDAFIQGSAQLTIDANQGSAIYMKNNELLIMDANLVLSSLYGSGLSGSGEGGLTIMNSTITATANPEYSSPALGGGWHDVQLADCYIELPEGGKYDPEKGVVDENDNIAYNVSIKPRVTYDIYIAGTQVTEDNASDILGNGTVSYSAGTKTLTLDGAYIFADGATDLEETGIYIGEEDVTILVAGSSDIYASRYGIHFTKDATITGTTRLTIETYDGTCICMFDKSLTIDGANLVLDGNEGGVIGDKAENLKIINSKITASSKSSLVSIGGSWQDVQLIDCFIELPEGGKYDPEKGVVDKNGDPAQEVHIKPSVAPAFYDIYVAGTQVKKDNASDILGDGTVRFDVESKTLTLDGANIVADGGLSYEDHVGIYVDEEDVTILVAGESTINSNASGIYFTKDATITGAARLTITNTFDASITMYENSLTIDGANLVLTADGSGLIGAGANTLTIKSSTITASSVDPDYPRSALAGIWQDVQLIDCYIELPEEGKYDPEKGVVDKNGDLAKEVRIKPTPGMSLEDIVVPADKAEKVLIDGILYIALPDGKVVNVLGQPVR